MKADRRADREVGREDAERTKKFAEPKQQSRDLLLLPFLAAFSLLPCCVLAGRCSSGRTGYSDTEAGRQAGRHTGRQAHRHTQAGTQAGLQQEGRQAGRQATGRQAGRQAGRLATQVGIQDPGGGPKYVVKSIYIVYLPVLGTTVQTTQLTVTRRAVCRCRGTVSLSLPRLPAPCYRYPIVFSGREAAKPFQEQDSPAGSAAPRNGANRAQAPWDRMYDTGIS
jgi:hypothetical protein